MSDMDWDFFETFNPDADALLRQMSKYIDNAALERIAEFDILGGKDRIAFVAYKLQIFRDEGTVPNPLSSDLEDSLMECTRFEPVGDRVQHHKDQRQIAGHWERAFACSVMLRAFGYENTRDCHFGGIESTLIQLLRSFPYLDVKFALDAMSMLAWLIATLEQQPRFGDINHVERAFAGTGLLLLAANSDTVPNAAIIELSRWLIKEEKLARRVHKKDEAFGTHWLLRKSHFADSAQNWVALGAEFASFDGKGARGDTARSIGQKLSGETPVS